MPSTLPENVTDASGPIANLAPFQPPRQRNREQRCNHHPRALAGKCKTEAETNTYKNAFSH
ncbi:hypothetical protein DEO72_LG5g1444 [Vigna unguiculata]|uniref:Uncharacterized protein n=1 Tax=Vigna unguiculata TaxID=3917 RepID=A0A4D6LWF2_VIGUN|nr:hypothetical protein DEO72_LG5g1444 [Vigna unguiculata]